MSCIGQVNEVSNRIGNYFLEQGLRKGDKVGVFMENCPEFIAIWLGLAKVIRPLLSHMSSPLHNARCHCQIGVIPALINFNLRLKPLQHCLEAAQCKALIFGMEVEKGTA